MGRHSTYTDKIAAEICERLAENGSIRETEKVTGIARTTISRWTAEHPNFASAIARAKQDGYAARAEKAVEDAKAAADAGLGRLAFDAERWMLSKLDPKRYGDRVTHAGDDEAPLHFKQVKEDADAVASSIASIVERTRAGSVVEQPDN